MGVGELRLLVLALLIATVGTSLGQDPCVLGWSTIGAGITDSKVSTIETLAVFDDGTGPALYAGGSFSEIGGVATASLAKWDGTSWSGFGTGLGSGIVRVLVPGAVVRPSSFARRWNR